MAKFRQALLRFVVAVAASLLLATPLPAADSSIPQLPQQGNPWRSRRNRMLHLITRQLYRRGWEKVTYRDLLRSYPLHGLITSQIAVAVAERATRIT
jgi:hypothetical protein